MEVLLDVWREACQHIEITESAERIARILAPRLPADLLVIRRLDLEHRRLETVTVGTMRSSASGRMPVHTRSDLTSEQLRAVFEWAATGDVSRAGDAAWGPAVSFVAPAGIEGDVIAGPLRTERGVTGVLVAIGSPRTRFSDGHTALLRSLLEPFAVALENHDRVHELARLREALEADKRALLSRLDRQDVTEAIVGHESGLRGVMQRVEQVAGTDAPVLLFGETGTGKEVVARAIHMRSARASAPVVRVNCGALPAGLVDSELFGHERGSFTGAVAARKGWFERADGGTLFLDEVAELPLDAQVRLLRIVQDGTFERVGGQKPITVDVRIVAATHRDLRAMVAAERFREDLWYRLSVFPIHLPPLRERLEDIPALASHFARRAGMRLGGSPLALSASDISLLVRYPWPGNVRELAAVIERAAILGEGRELRVASALGPIPRAANGSARDPSSPPRAQPAPQPESDHALSVDSLEEATRKHIELALADSFGRIEGPFGAARRLGVNPHTLRSRMRRLRIDWRRFRRHPTSPVPRQPGLV
jgi:hydrogenase-4 transcriptional activator